MEDEASEHVSAASDSDWILDATVREGAVVRAGMYIVRISLWSYKC